MSKFKGPSKNHQRNVRDVPFMRILDHHLLSVFAALCGFLTKSLKIDYDLNKKWLNYQFNRVPVDVSTVRENGAVSRHHGVSLPVLRLQLHLECLQCSGG